MPIDLGFHSHFPLLAACIASTSGPVLELGTGWGSTPLIHYAANGRFIASADTDPEWLTQFSVGYGGPSHQFHFIEPKGKGVSGLMIGWETWNFPSTMMWAVVFVDCAPGEVRVPLIAKLRQRARFIVAHDTEADEPPGGGNYRWRDLNGLFKYQSTMKRMRPWTTVYSDFEPFHLETCDAD